MPPPPVPAEPEIEIDPEEAKKLEYVAKKLFGPSLKELEGLKQAIHQTRVELAASEGSRRVANYGLSAEQMQKARFIFDKMHRAGITEWSMQDSVRQILGEATEAQLAKKLAAETQRSRMNGTHTIPFQAGPPGVGGGSVDLESDPNALPKNFDSLPAKEQIKLLKKRNVENKPI